jgi:maleylpyruvate isomerase
MVEGTLRLRDVVDGLDDAELALPSLLPGWSRRHVVAHVAANAEALRRLARWAATGVEERMYASPEQRATEIDDGSRLPASALRAWLADSADLLARDLADLSEPSWQAQVVSGRGRTIPASEIPWLRAREVMIHAVDLSAAVGFADLPEGFLLALLDEIVETRSVGGGPAAALCATDAPRTWRLSGVDSGTAIEASITVLAAWLTGRPVPASLPEIPPWL